ncbi:MAG: Na+/H+ antiporter subunit D [Chloroflexaceae bacterium]|nr:Na+/H+ antiporter subunit D [Chloroflexaceae bacterium]
MNNLLFMPIVIPLITAICLILLWRQRVIQRLVSLVGCVSLFLAAALLFSFVAPGNVLAIQAANWPAPFGITLVADTFSALMVLVAAFMGLSVAIYSLATLDPERESFGYHPLYHIMLMGVCGAFLTGDMFNMYVWYEVMLISSFVLLTLGGERSQLEGGVKYVTLNLLASTLFLIATGMLYGTMGTLNLADLGERMRQPETLSDLQLGLMTTLPILYLLAFGIKSALFPLFFWLPASYHTPPIHVTAIFSALLTKVGIYSLVRVFTLVFIADTDFTHTILLVIAGLTMITGVLGAVAQMEMRRLLSFHIVSQIGYLLMGLGLFSPLSLAGTVFFMVHVILAKSALFLVGGVLHRVAGTYDLKKLGGFYRSSIMLSILFFLPAFSLAGIPPLSGFWAKFALVRAGLELGQYAIVTAALAVSILTLFSMTKIWAEAFWKAQPPGKVQVDADQISRTLASGQTALPLLLPIVVIAALMVIIGVAADPVLAISQQAANQLLDPTDYINVVLHESASLANSP